MTKSSQPLDDLLVILRKHGLIEAADNFEDLMTCAWTSSSEFIGELGLAILGFQKEHPTMPTEVRGVLKRCLKEIRAVWPGIRL